MNQSSSLRLALQFGAYSGVASFILFLGTYYAGYNPIGQSSWLGFWIPILFIVIGVRTYKNTECKGYLPYTEAVKAGLRISIATAFVFSGLVYIFGSTIGSDFVEVFKIDMLEQFELQKSALGQDLYEKDIAALEVVDLTLLVFSVALFKVVGGLILSLVIATFVKNTDIQFTKEEEMDEENITSPEQNQ